MLFKTVLSKTNLRWARLPGITLAALAALLAAVGSPETLRAQVDVVFLIDGSSSIDAADFELERQGLSLALQNPLLLPRDGTVALAIVQFAGNSTRVEVPYRLIASEADVMSVQTSLAAMTQLRGATNPGDGVNQAMALLNAAGNPMAQQSVCLATDGVRNSGADLPTALTNAQASPIGLDRFGVIAIEDPPSFFEADFQAEYGPLVFGGANVTVVRNAAEYANTVGGACLPSALRLVGLEVNQAIQDWSDSVQLIAGKTTYVRAHIETTDSRSVVAVARLRGSRGGVELAGSPLVPINPGGSIVAPIDAAAVRGTFNSSLNFRLPTSWLSGDVELTVEGVGTDLDCAEAADAAGDCSVDVRFGAAVPPDMHYVRVSWSDGTNTFEVGDVDVDELIARQVAISPTASVVSRRELLRWPGTTSPDPRDVNNTLEWMRFWDLCWPIFGCDRLYYGAIDGPRGGGGLANGIPGTVSSGYLPFPTQDSYGRNRHVHEAAHTLGMSHAPFCGAVTGGVTPLPYETAVIGGQTRATLGPMNLGEDRLIYGLDTNALQVIDPNLTFEMLSYCGGLVDGARWISQVSYDALLTASSSTFSILAGPAAVPAANGAGADYLVVRGSIDLGSDAVELRPFGTMTTSMPPPMPDDGPYTLRALDGSGVVLHEIDFAPAEQHADASSPGGAGGSDPGTGSFMIPVRDAALVEQVAVLRGGAVLAMRSASAAAPAPRVIAPNGGEVLAAADVMIEWQAADGDGDALTYLVQYSADGGATWKTLVADWPETSYQLERRYLAGSDSAMVRVLASDGFRSQIDASDDVFTVANNPPEVQLLSPRTGDSFVGVQMLFLEAAIEDREDGPLDGGSVEWRSSLDGVLGTGAELDLIASDLEEGRHEIRVTATDSAGASSSAAVTVDVGRIGSVACVEGPTTLCLNQNRFQVRVDWRDFDGDTGVGRVAPFRSGDSGLFSFFAADNLEVLVKVLDACSFNDQFWVFAAASTNVEYTLEVVDTVTGASKSYFNPLGNMSPAITDTSAFATCAAMPAGGTSTSVRLDSSEFEGQETIRTFSPGSGGAATGTCVSDATTLCLNDGRFRVETEWRTFRDRTGPGRRVPFGTVDSGLLWFFRDTNWEQLVKVINGCAMNGNFWVFAAATTNVEYTLRVTDTQTGDVVEYFNPLGQSADAIGDTAAFPTCP